MRGTAVRLIERVAASLLAVGCAAVTIETPRPPVPTASNTAAITIPISTPKATVAPTPTATPSRHSTDPSAVLLRMEYHDYHDCKGLLCHPPLVVFAVYGDGRAAYRTSLTEASADVRIVQLDEPSIDELLAFSIGDGGLPEIESYSAFNAISHVTFEVRSTELTKSGAVGQGLSQLLESQMPSYQPFKRLARRLVDFDAEVGDRASTPAPCAVSPLGTIPRDERAVWDQPIWQTAMTGVWAAPFGKWPSSAAAHKVLWWVPEGHGLPLEIHIARIPDGVGADLELDLVLGADTAFPNRPDRPSGMPSLPPGCYKFTVSIGSDSGSLIEQVVL